MPAFAGTGQQIWQIVAFTRTLSVGQAAARAKGDAARGARVFASAGCSSCHTVGNEGGVTGPDLTNVGSRRSLGFLQRAVLDPNAEVPPDYWTLRARTRDGREISGVRLNEDTHSFQFRNAGGLGAVLKKDLAEHTIIRTSPMPSFRGKLSDPEFEDLIAYLASLREGGRP
jgi:putative heme-binding domain-containing protein